MSKAIFVVYALWITGLDILYLRRHGERVVGEILYDANLPLILIFMTILVYFTVNQKIDVLGRMAEILTIVLVVAFFTVFVLVVPKIRLENIYPVTYYDLLPAIFGTIPIVGISSYITIIMIMGDKITNKGGLKKGGIKLTLFFSLVLCMLIFETIGLFGYKLTSQFVFPYFSTLKSIRILDSIERLESLFISIWITSDYIFITVFLIAIISLIRHIVRVKSFNILSIILLLVIFIGAVNLPDNIYRTEFIARNIGMWTNVALFWFLPILAWIIGRCRKII